MGCCDAIDEICLDEKDLISVDYKNAFTRYVLGNKLKFKYERSGAFYWRLNRCGDVLRIQALRSFADYIERFNERPLLVRALLTLFNKRP